MLIPLIQKHFCLSNRTEVMKNSQAVHVVLLIWQSYLGQNACFTIFERIKMQSAVKVFA